MATGMMNHKQLRYDGLVDPTEFLNAFGLQALMYNWNEDKQVLAIGFMLTGKAKRVVETMTGDKTKIDQIKNAILAGCVETKEVLMSQFNAARPKPNELISEYATRLQLLLERAMPGLGAPHATFILRGHLATHLPNYMQALISYNQKMTWDELLSALDAAHPYIIDMTNPIKNNQEFKLEANSLRMSGDERRCHVCKEIGHLKRNCPKNSFKANSSESYRSNRNQNQSYNNGNSNKKSYNNNNNNSSHSNSRNNNSYSNNNNSGRKSSHNSSNNRTCESYKCLAQQEEVTSEEEQESPQITRKHINTLEIKHSETTELIKTNKGDTQTTSSVNSIVLDMNTIIAKVPLLRKSVQFALADGSQKCKLRALFDGGASNCFVRLSCLPAQLQKIVKNFDAATVGKNEYGLVKESLTIVGATGTSTGSCIIASAKLIIGDWSGCHMVVITESLIDRDLIIGRDFLKKYNVTINHGTDEIFIDKASINQKLSDPVCYVVETQEVLAKSETIIKCHTNLIPENQEVLFTPCNVAESVYWSNCVSKVNRNGDFFVKVINLAKSNLQMETGARIGTITEDFQIVEDSESFELKTVKMSETNRNLIEGLKEKLSRFKVGKKLTNEQTVKISDLVTRNLSAFQWSDDDVGRTNLIEHEIHTGSNKPIKQRQFKIPQAVQGVLDEQIKDLIKNNLIEPSSSPWCSPMMIVKQRKRDGSFKYRFVCDMKGVNSVTEKDSFPLQRMDQALDQLGGAKYFSVVDMSRGYFQVPLSEKDRHKTAFTANGQLYQWKVMCLGLCNAPSTFTRLMDLVLNGLTFVYCLVYLDDTIVYSKSFDEHLAHLDEIFSRLIKAGLKLNPDKCVFAADEVGYLGYIVSVDGIRPDPEKVKAINDIEFPKSPKEMLRFLGAANFYRDFIHKFSNIASPLYKMSQSKQKFREKLKDKRVFEAFEKLKGCLMSTPVLTYPDWKLGFVVQTDASGYAIGGVLGQYVNKKFKPIMYAGRHLTAAETRYSTTERELLAVVFCNKKFKAYLYGRHCKFIVDHEPLVTMRKLKEPMGRIGNLLNKLQDTDYEMIYQPGALHFTPDLLSRP